MRLFALLSVLVCSAVMAAGADPAPKGAEAPRIAVLRLEDTLTGFKQYTAGMDRLKKEVAEGQAAIKALEDRLQVLDGQIQVIKPDSPEFLKATEEFEVTKLKEQMMVKRGNEDIDKRRAVLVKEAYTSLRAQLSAFCQERGIKLVHLAPNPELQALTNKELNQQLFAQSVLYYDASLDITDAFIPYLNEHWTPDAKAPAPAPAPNPPVGK
ncbi:MAG: OmpH family outer membrane protein [Planctomycetes bacterium]|nr:OmpH family outer membrane protein [Planctomycetota bacterium]